MKISELPGDVLIPRPEAESLPGTAAVATVLPPTSAAVQAAIAASLVKFFMVYLKASAGTEATLIGDD